MGASDRPWLTRDRRIRRDVAVAAAVLAVIALAASAAGLTGLAGRAGGMAGSGGLLVVLVLGFAAGLSTCMALVGGLVLAVSARFAEHRPDLTGAQKLRPHLAFNAGRVLGFAVLGAGAGGRGLGTHPERPTGGRADDRGVPGDGRRRSQAHRRTAAETRR